MRDDISYIAERQSKANNKYMKHYNSSEESKLVFYLDKNNLYGWVLSLYLTYGRFNWLSYKEIDKCDVNSIGKISVIGYILEVDLAYPDND